MVDPDAMAEVVWQAIEVATAPLLARIAVLERTKAQTPERGERGEKGEAGQNGRDADPLLLDDYRRQLDAMRTELATLKAARVEPDVEALAFKAAALVKAPKDGRDAVVDLDALALKAAALVPKPQDGKDAPAVDVEAIAKRAAALVPVPANGKDAPPVDVEALAVKAAALIQKPADGKHGQDGKPGRDGTSVTPEDLEPLIQRQIAKAISTLPTPRDGKDGRDGTSVSAAEIVPMVHAEVVKAVSAITVLKGETGEPGKPGERGPEGPAGRDGRDGAQGIQGERGQDGRDGQDGAVGPPGETGQQGRTGEKGEPGQDGVGFDDADLVVDEATKSVVLRFTKGDVVKDRPVPVPLYWDVYSDAQTYRKGNIVTRGGSMWMALLDEVKGVRPDDKTDAERRAWRLCVQRGKEGKAGPVGQRGLPGQDLRWERDG